MRKVTDVRLALVCEPPVTGQSWRYWYLEAHCIADDGVTATLRPITWPQQPSALEVHAAIAVFLAGIEAVQGELPLRASIVIDPPAEPAQPQVAAPLTAQPSSPPAPGA